MNEGNHVNAGDVLVCECYLLDSSSTQVVEEHFARSLGSEYMRLMKHPAAPSSAPPSSSSLDSMTANVADSRPSEAHISIAGTSTLSATVEGKGTGRKEREGECLYTNLPRACVG